ncbi:Cyanovirin-N [Cercophora newfieldiana]|uniref:Cyanovirin-N n=1 Tax=Cercophora newfieldiana TaxID=92897 RepID=A0AA39YPW7_9PEZI|nr:Cyanovirin-N [Cercophora newfieldiana]
MFHQFIVFFTALLAATLTAVDASSGFTGSCTMCDWMEDTRLQVQCKRTNGDILSTELDLNNCFTTMQGKLRPAEDAANYHGSCFNCKIDWNNGATMTCLCTNDGVVYDHSSIVLNDFIGNNDGFIHCRDGMFGSVQHTCGDFDRPQESQQRL